MPSVKGADGGTPVRGRVGCVMEASTDAPAAAGDIDAVLARIFSKRAAWLSAFFLSCSGSLSLDIFLDAAPISGGVAMILNDEVGIGVQGREGTFDTRVPSDSLGGGAIDELP